MKTNTFNSTKWIFIRGLARSSGHWGDLISVFPKYFPEDDVELLDVRGNGELSKENSYLTIEDNVRDLRARSKFIQAGESVHLLTISMGSMIGSKWAEMFPEEIESLTLMNTSDKGSSAFYERLRPGVYLQILKLLSLKKSQEEIELEILNFTSQKHKSNQSLAKEFARIPLTSKGNMIRQLMAAAQYEFSSQKPKTDVLILSSYGDEMVNPNCSRDLAAKWNLKAHFHPSAGHDLSLDDPDWVCQKILEWSLS